MPARSFLDILAIFGAQYLYLVLLAAALVWYLLQPRARQIEMIAWGIVALPLMLILLIIVGKVYFDARPPYSDNITPLIMHDPDNGFPSDHTLLCAATASIVFFYNKNFSAVLWLMTALVGFSRVYTGIHHTFDIVASIILAVTVSLFVWKLVLPRIRSLPAYVW
ncbi:MAG: phosphatase PAP2 family protein [Acidobacteriota bacterium]